MTKALSGVIIAGAGINVSDDGNSLIISSTSASPFSGAGAGGAVPDPLVESGLYLRDDGTWAAPPGGGAALFVGAGAAGLVPDPGAEAAKFLRDDGTWADPASLPAGAMLKSQYDQDDNGLVDSAEEIAGAQIAGNDMYYGTNDVGVVGFFPLPEAGTGGGGTGPVLLTTVASPGATWNAAPEADEHYLVQLDQNCTFVWTTTLPDDRTDSFKLWLDRGGHAITWPAGTILSPNVDLTGSDGTRELLIVESYNDPVLGAVWFVSQYGSWIVSEPSIDLPQDNLVHAYTFQTDFQDSVGAAHFIPQNGASIIATGKHGVNLVASSLQYLRLDQAFFDVNADWTLFVGIDVIRTGGNQSVFKFGAGVGYIDMYVAPDLGTPRLRFLNKDQANVYGDTIEFDLVDLPAAEQVWMLRKNGVTIYVDCLTNPALSGSGTMTSGNYSSSIVTIGANLSLGRYYDGGTLRPIYGFFAYDTYITDQAVIDAVHAFFTGPLGLTNA